MTFVHRETVRFRDCDPMGHLNNAVFSTYLEQARLAYGGGQSDIIHARTEIDFRSPAFVGEAIEISVVPGRIGTKSFELLYELRAGDRLIANAKTVLVGYDYGRSESTPVPDGWRRRLSE
jgi:acyl-CoA thioester hydrolase